MIFSPDDPVPDYSGDPEKARRAYQERQGKRGKLPQFAKGGSRKHRARQAERAAREAADVPDRLRGIARTMQEPPRSRDDGTA